MEGRVDLGDLITWEHYKGCDCSVFYIVRRCLFLFTLYL